MTSWLVMRSLTGRPRGTCSSLISRRPWGCWVFHIHCLPMTYISIASLGGRETRTYTADAQPNITRVMTNGTMVQVSSSALFVGTFGGGGSAISIGSGVVERRRYLRPRYTMQRKMSSVKKTVTTRRKIVSWSIDAAVEE